MVEVCLERSKPYSLSLYNSKQRHLLDPIGGCSFTDIGYQVFSVKLGCVARIVLSCLYTGYKVIYSPKLMYSTEGCIFSCRVRWPPVVGHHATHGEEETRLHPWADPNWREVHGWPPACDWGEFWALTDNPNWEINPQGSTDLPPMNSCHYVPTPW